MALNAPSAHDFCALQLILDGPCRATCVQTDRIPHGLTQLDNQLPDVDALQIELLAQQNAIKLRLVIDPDPPANPPPPLFASEAAIDEVWP